MNGDHPSCPAGPELSRRVTHRDLERRGRLSLDIVADPGEREALARRFGLERIDDLVGRVEIAADRGGAVWRVTGTIEATVLQESAVSLEPIELRVADRFSEIFVSEDADERAETAEIDIDPDEDPVDVLPADGVDVGEVLAQNLGLALDPYARAEGEELPPPAEEPGEDAAADGDGTHRPFAALARRMAGKPPSR